MKLSVQRVKEDSFTLCLACFGITSLHESNVKEVL